MIKMVSGSDCCTAMRKSTLWTMLFRCYMKGLGSRTTSALISAQKPCIVGGWTIVLRQKQVVMLWNWALLCKSTARSVLYLATATISETIIPVFPLLDHSQQPKGDGL